MFKLCNIAVWNDYPMNRREFILTSAMLFLPRLFTSKIKEENLVEAKWYKQLDKSFVQCQLCFRKCTIKDGGRSYCTNRVNRNGKLYTLVYNNIAGIQIDPVEKEPLYHFLPGTKTLCFGTAGCNFRCIFCHNWHLSTKNIEDLDAEYLTPENAISKTKELGCTSISFTYNEPTVFYEWVYDVTKLAKKNNIRVYIHTNGGINPDPLKDLIKYLDAVCIDLKGFTTQFYYDTSFSKFEHILDTLKIVKSTGIWFELVNLIIPTMNDDLEKTREMCLWIRDNLNKEVPLHFSRFFPSYKLTQISPTPIETLEKAKKIANDVGLDYVTIGNVPGHQANSTYCPKCNKIIIKRIHFAVLENNLNDGKCKFCGHKIPGVWV